MTEEMHKKGDIVNLCHYHSPCGEIILASTCGKLCLCDWDGMPCAHRNMRRIQKLLKGEFRVEPSSVLRQTARELDEYFAQSRKTFDIPLLTAGTDFQKSVWRALLDVPYGKTRNYMQIARQVGTPMGVRAVAQAIAANGICILVPCHRIIGSDHSLTGFAGGLDIKKALLEMEGALMPSLPENW